MSIEDIGCGVDPDRDSGRVHEVCSNNCWGFSITHLCGRNPITYLYGGAPIMTQGILAVRVFKVARRIVVISGLSLRWNSEAR